MDATTLLLIASNSFDKYTGGVSSSCLSGIDISWETFPGAEAGNARCGCGDDVRVVILENGGSLSLLIRLRNKPPKLLRPDILLSPFWSTDDDVELRPLHRRLLALCTGEFRGLELASPDAADVVELDRNIIALPSWDWVGQPSCDRMDTIDCRRAV